MRTGGLALIAVLLLSAVARTLAPTPSTPSAEPPSSAPTGPVPVAVEKGSNPDSGPYQLALADKIRDFFGQDHSSYVNGLELPCQSADLNYWCVPLSPGGGARQKIAFIIATVPDPVHTHLSLFFDRSIDAIEQGATSQGYFFDRAIMPWHYLDDPNSNETPDQTKLRESFPGLLIFRNQTYSSMALPLFVFVVGETPTSGINEEQLHHALDIIHDIRGPEPLIPPPDPEFGILGPTFSGSLYSLGVILNSYLNGKSPPPFPEIRTLPVYTTLTGTLSIQSFHDQFSGRLPQVRPVLFEEDGDAISNALRCFVVDALRYDQSDIASLSEDETAYGATFVGQPLPTNPVCGADTTKPESISLYFPRGISQFRSEYTKEFQSNGASGEGAGGNPPQQQRNLRLDLSVTGGDDDSVAPYAKAQMPLSQEGIMLAIVSELRMRQPKFILLRASDPLDELFLARYLRDKYPQGRLVIPAPDLLFPRDEGGQLDGVLGLNSYPLFPPSLNQDLSQSCGDPGNAGAGPLFFPSSSSAALYNATAMLVKRLTNASGRPGSTDPKLSDSPCPMSPNLWLTVLSRNSIHPIKVLRVAPGQASGYFPDFHSNKMWGIQQVQRITRIPPVWIFSYIFWLALAFVYCYRSWKGGTLGLWDTPKEDDSERKFYQKKVFILWLGGIIIVGLFAVLDSVNWPLLVKPDYKPAWGWTFFMWLPLLFFLGFTVRDFVKKRGENLLAVLFPIVAVAVCSAGICYANSVQPQMVLWEQRGLDLASGVSPATPLLALLLGLFVWFWYSFQGKSLVDWRSPQLPAKGELPPEYFRLTDSVDCIRNLIQPFLGPHWNMDYPALIIVICLAVGSAYISPGHVPLRSLEGRPFDIFYSFFLGLSLFALIAALLRMFALWQQFHLMLTGLNRPGLRDALQRLKGFEWNSIWNPLQNMENEGYKLVAREIRVIEHLDQSLGKAPEDSKSDPDRALREQIGKILNGRDKLRKIARQGSDECPPGKLNMDDLRDVFPGIQMEFGALAALLCTTYLDKSWKNLIAEVVSETSDDKKSTYREIARVYATKPTINLEAATEGDPLDPSGLSQTSLRLAEEFFACVYANFLVTVLLRVRGLVFSSVTLYVFIVFSTISYPFEPSTELTALAIALFVFSGGVIGSIYAEMHHDPALKSMTSTDPNKLDASFWIKIVSTGFAPFVALVSSVYPPFGHLLYTLVGPLLQALR